MTLLDRHIEFVHALRQAGLNVSLAEALDAVAAIEVVGIADRERLRASYAATMVKRQSHRRGFDEIFDLFFPARVGDGLPASGDVNYCRLDEIGGGGATGSEAETAGVGRLADGPEELAAFQEQLVTAMGMGDPEVMAALAREAVQRFGLIRGRGPGEQRWSTYNVMNRTSPESLIQRTMQGLLGELDDDPAIRRLVQAQVESFERLVDAEVRRRAAEVRGPEYVARHTVARSIEQRDFTSLRRADLEQMRQEIQPLARRLATRLTKEHHSQRQRGALDFRRTVRDSISSGGVPLRTHHRPKRPHRNDLVVLCDVSGSVANFAGFTLMLMYALREQFSRLRAFTFVDDVHEVTDRFRPGADPATVMAELASSAEMASLWGRTNYGRAFTAFAEKYPDAVTPRTSFIVLGDARSNYSDLALPVVKELVHASRKAFWLNPEHPNNWNTGDSAAADYQQLLPMVECRNLIQLGEFVHDLA